jgi:hypothetical protein
MRRSPASPSRMYRDQSAAIRPDRFKSQPGGGTDTLQYYLYVNDNPLGIITLWPVPDSVIPDHAQY